MKKKVYVHGSFMNDNYGDFLLYYASVRKAKSIKGDFDIISSDVSETYDQYININRMNKYKSLLTCDAAFLAGGGYFSEPPTRKLYWNIRFLLKHALPLTFLGIRKKPYSILGTGAGPMSYKLTQKITKMVFQNAELISVRDVESKKFLEEIGIKKEIKIVPDWVMGMEKEDLVREQKSIDQMMQGNDFSKFIYIHLTTKNDASNPGMEIVVNDLVKHSKEHGDYFYIVGCDQNRQTQEDRAKEIINRLPTERVLFFPYKGPWMLSSMLNFVDTVVTDKLHVGIVATRLNKYVISVPYHTKTLRFYNQLGLSDRSILLKDITANEVFRMLDSDQREIKNLDQIVEKATENYRLLEQFLNEI